MSKIWVALLAAVAFILGAWAGLVYSGGTGGIAGFRIACALLDTAEGARLLTRAQRADVVDRAMRQMQRHEAIESDTGRELLVQLKTGCPKLPDV